jgi:iron complex transport system ATP-binding protein
LGEGSTAPRKLEQLVRLVDASARYPEGDTLAVEKVSLVARAGEVTALLGANGAGKSTLLRLVAGLLGASAGTVSVGGRDVTGLDRRALARAVALVPQNERVAEGFRVRDVVAMGRAPHQDGWMHASREDFAAVDEAVRRCDLHSVADRNVETLSGGEQRRVAVARALAQKPRVLALDEPAAFLDIRHRLELHDLLSEVASRDGVACLVAMHDLDAAARMARHVILLRSGRVVAAGAPDEVMTPSRLAETFDAEVDVGVHAASGARTFFAVRPAPRA